MSIAPAPGGCPEPLWRRVVGFPSTRAGRWAAWLTGGVMAVLALVGGLVAVDFPEWGVAATGVLVIFALAGVLTAIVAGAIALRAVAKGERSIVVLGPLLFGSYCLLFLLGLVVPH